MVGQKAGDANFRAYEARNDNAPQGYLPVTSLADNNLSDTALTLREAMLVANGTLTTSFSTVERGLLEDGGCIFNGSGVIIGGCGRGITDTVVITPGLAGTITLSAALPPINDTQPTRLQVLRGLIGHRRTTLWRSTDAFPGFDSLATIFDVLSSGNDLSGWTLLNAQRGVRVSGNDNQLGFLTVYSHSVAGLDIAGGDNNTLFTSSPTRQARSKTAIVAAIGWADHALCRAEQYCRDLVAVCTRISALILMAPTRRTTSLRAFTSAVLEAS